jgi:hypothetical protein
VRALRQLYEVFFFSVICCGSHLLCPLDGIIIFEIATSQLWGMGIRAVAVVAPLFFFIWGARETFRFFKNARS